jgi:opacity protein-like surface antigen
MRNRILAGLAIMSVLMFATPRTASADWMFTPFVGATFGGSVTDVGGFELERDTRGTFGAGLTWMGAGVLGFDIDFGYTPDFFGDDPDFGDSNVTTLMANVILGAPIGGQSGPGFRPYAVGGIGLLRERITSAEDFFDDVSRNEMGFNLGAGVNAFFSDNLGLRGDVRYFRALQRGSDARDRDVFDIDDLNFWRATLGVTFRFGG